MMRHPGFGQIRRGYIFGEIRERLAGRICDRHGRRLISLGVGDATRPITRAVADAMSRAAREMSVAATFRGYGPTAGYAFLRDAVAERYAARGLSLTADEVFVTDGAKSCLTALAALWGDVPMYLPCPAYPATADACRLAGREIVYLPCDEARGFLPRPEDLPPRPGVVWLCSPANPQGVAFDYPGLAAWVAAARRRGDVIVSDAAYAPFVSGRYPASVYEAPEGRACAVEVCSLSKGASFTGLRCGWCVIPRGIVTDGGIPLRDSWTRRAEATVNGVAYPVQRAAEAALPDEAAERDNAAAYLEGARLLAAALGAAGYRFCGGEVSPYLWVACKNGGGSWSFFENWVENKGLVVTPGVGFGEGGDGYVRLSAFCSPADCAEAAERIRNG
ncbi:MAG: aminotransferase class I/II-fold pyridoxal phosphate-dependent enzyme [Clostridia bacterium]|nr:aminotransferase class I/II-fold pyridoxal phosphate-dependent enzyme [Clostridia bacterium]